MVNMKTKIFSITLLAVFCIFGIYIASVIINYEDAINGILGIAVLYLLYHRYVAQSHTALANVQTQFGFPKTIRDFVEIFLISLLVSLAFRQVMSAMGW
jgi:hypothetical protein